LDHLKSGKTWANGTPSTQTTQKVKRSIKTFWSFDRLEQSLLSSHDYLEDVRQVQALDSIPLPYRQRSAKIATTNPVILSTSATTDPLTALGTLTPYKL